MESTDTPKRRKKRSWLWSHFTENTDLIAECNHCQAQVCYKDGTNKMKGHLKKQHQILIEYDESKRQKVEYTQQMQLESAVYDLGLVILTQSDRAIFFADCHIPLATVENESFHNLLSFVAPSFNIPSRHLLREVMITESHKVIANVCSALFFFKFSLLPPTYRSNH